MWAVSIDICYISNLNKNYYTIYYFIKIKITPLLVNIGNIFHENK